MINLLKRLFKRKKIVKINQYVITIPEAFGFKENSFKLLVDDLTAIIPPDDRLKFLHEYFEGQAFARFNLDLNKTNDAIVTGYALCTAIFVQSSRYRSTIVEKVINAFNKKVVN